MITHVVLFRFAREEEAREARERLVGMSGRIPGMLDLTAGLDFSRGERSYDLGLVTHHDSRASLELYQTHPVHLEVVAFIRAHATDRVVCDFESDR